MKFNYYAKLYLNFGKTQWKKSTFIKNSSIVKNRFSEFLNLDIDIIKPSMIKTWLIQLKDVGNKSKRHYINALNSIFNLALQDDMINKNPINFLIQLGKNRCILVKLPTQHLLFQLVHEHL